LVIAAKHDCISILDFKITVMLLEAQRARDQRGERIGRREQIVLLGVLAELGENGGERGVVSRARRSRVVACRRGVNRHRGEVDRDGGQANLDWGILTGAKLDVELPRREAKMSNAE